MNIGLCDDNKEWLKTAQTILENYIKTQAYDAEIYCFQTSRQLLDFSEHFQERSMDILFLDIQLHQDDSSGSHDISKHAAQEDGIQAGEMINEKWPGCQIIYLTNYLYYATEVYQTRHVYFVLKEQFEQKIDLFMRKAVHELAQSKKLLHFLTIGGNVLQVPPQDILYIERIVRITKIVTIHGSYDTLLKIPQICESLPQTDFIRCHNSCIIYCPAVREMLKSSFVMMNDREVPISRSYLKSAKQAFLLWALTQTS